MPHLTTGTPEHTALQVLAERMGAAEFAARLQAERRMRARQGVGNSRGWFRFEHYWDFYGLIRSCLKLTGLWARAHRNYFDIHVVLQYCIYNVI